MRNINKEALAKAIGHLAELDEARNEAKAALDTFMEEYAAMRLKVIRAQEDHREAVRKRDSHYMRCLADGFIETPQGTPPVRTHEPLRMTGALIQGSSLNSTTDIVKGHEPGNLHSPSPPMSPVGKKFGRIFGDRPANDNRGDR